MWQRSQTKQKLIEKGSVQTVVVGENKQLILRFCTEEWGTEATSRDVPATLWEIIKADYSVERSDFLGTRLALLDEIIEASIRCNTAMQLVL